MDIKRILDTVRPALEAGGHPLALAGAFALNAHGYSRATVDLDLIAPAAAQPKLIATLEGAGFVTLYRSAGYSNHLHADLEPIRPDD